MVKLELTDEQVNALVNAIAPKIEAKDGSCPVTGSTALVVEIDKLRAEIERLTRELEQSRQRYEDAAVLAGVKDAENRGLRRDADLLRETIDGLEREAKEARAEIARMRPVVDAAVEWAGEQGVSLTDEVRAGKKLAHAVRVYRSGADEREVEAKTVPIFTDAEWTFIEHRTRCAACFSGQSLAFMCEIGYPLYEAAVKDYHPEQNVWPLFTAKGRSE